MTLDPNLVALLQNTALLLAMVVVFDLATSRQAVEGQPLRQALVGVAFGVIGIAIMLAPLHLEPGIVFDTRSVLLAVSGLFLGAVPTAVAAVMTATLRVLRGGTATWVGIAVILTSAGLGLAWRRARRRPLTDVRWHELYGLGLAVHVVMLVLMLTLPGTTGWRVLGAIGLPVLLIYPLLTVAVGLFFVSRLRREALALVLAEREEQLRVMFETASIGIAQADVRTGLWCRVNARFCEMTGYSSDEMLALHVPDITHPEDRMRDWHDFQRVVRGEAPSYRIEKRYLRKDKTLVWVNVNMTVIRDANGEPTRTVATIEDISERRRTEEALIREQRLLHSLMSTVPDGIYFKDRERRFIRISNAQAHRFGLADPESAVGRTDSDFFTAEHADQAQTDEQRIIDTGQPLVGIEEKETWPDGRMTWVSTTKVPMYDASGRVAGLMGVSRDITGRKRAEQELRRLLAEADQSRRALLSVIEDQKRTEEERESLAGQLAQAQKMEAIGQLAGGIAHDFNNILAVILGYAESVQRRMTSRGKQHGRIEEIRRAAERGASLTHQLLAFSRKQVLEPRVLDLNVLLSDITPMLNRLIGEDVKLVTALEHGIGPIRADEGQMQQVLMNLAANARDAMHRGGTLTLATGRELREPRSDPSSPSRGSYVALSVHDTGHGMDEETLARIFEPFFTTKEPGKGTGLGLATVYGIVKQSGGYVEVESRPGSGTTFRVCLPEIEGQVAPAPQPQTFAFIKGGSETILLLEDDPALRDLEQELLEEAGYQVLVARQPEEAFAACDSPERIDLLLSDVIMPGISGPALAGELVQRQPSLKVLYVSGYTADMVAKHGVLEPSVRLLQKPFTTEGLLRAVRIALDDPGPA